MTRSLAYLKSDKIRVNAVCPGFVKTGITKSDNGYIKDWIEMDLAIEAFMMAIQDDTLAGIFGDNLGDAIRVTAQLGIDFPYRKKVRTSKSKL